MGFPGQEYHSRLPFPFPGDPPDPGIKLGSSALQAGSLPTEPPGKPNCKGETVVTPGPLGPEEGFLLPEASPDSEG